MTTTDIAGELDRFVRAYGQVPADDQALSPRTDLWEEGYLDSAGVVEMIDFIEQTFSVHVPDEALFLPEFTCIEGMAEVVTRLQNGGKVA